MTLGYRTEELAESRAPDPVARMVRRIYAGAGPAMGLVLFILLTGNPWHIAGPYYDLILLLISSPLLLLMAYVAGLPSAIVAGWMMTASRGTHAAIRIGCSIMGSVLTSSLWAVLPELRQKTIIIPFLITSGVCALLLGIMAVRMERPKTGQTPD